MHPEGGNAAQWEWAPLLLLLLTSLTKRMSQARAFSRIALQRIRPLIVDIGDSTPRPGPFEMRCDARAMPATASLYSLHLDQGECKTPQSESSSTISRLSMYSCTQSSPSTQ